MSGRVSGLALRHFIFGDPGNVATQDLTPQLTGKYLNGIPEGARASREGSLSLDLINDETLARIRALNELAARRGQSLAQLALAWALRDPRVTSALVGASSVEQLESNVAALGGPALTEDELAGIDRYAVDSGVNIWAASSSE